jgi:hypothetical protein
MNSVSLNVPSPITMYSSNVVAIWDPKYTTLGPWKNLGRRWGHVIPRQARPMLHHASTREPVLRVSLTTHIDR